MNLKALKKELERISTAAGESMVEVEYLEAFCNKQAAEINKLNSIIDELRDENERLKQEAKGGEA